MPRRKKNSRGSRAGRPRGRRSRLAAASLAELQAEIERRQRLASVLQSQRQRLLSELTSIEAELSLYGDGPRRRGRPPRMTAIVATGARRGRPPKASAGGRRRGRRSGRGSNGQSLVESLRQVLRGKTMGVSEVASAVQKAGYKTGSPNFRTIVNAALLGNGDKFKKVSRGQYTSK